MSNDPQSWIQKYKEFIVTTIICLILTGIYDSLNSQNEKIDKWYETMIKLQGTVNENTKDMDRFQGKIDNHEGRIRNLEIEVTPWVSEQRRSEQIKEDTAHVESS